MKRKLDVKFVCIPLLYLAIACVFLYLHFFTGNRIVTERVPPIKLQAQYDDEKLLKSLKVFLPRITLSFYPDRPLDLIFADGSIVTPHISGYEIIQNGFLLKFTDGFFLTCATGSPTGPIRIIPESRRPGAKPLRLVLPFQISSDAFVHKDSDSRLFTFTQGSDVYTVKHPEGATLDTDANRYVLIGNNGDLGELSIEIQYADRFRLADYFATWQENRRIAREERQARTAEAQRQKEEAKRVAAEQKNEKKKAAAEKISEPQFPWFTESALAPDAVAPSVEKETSAFIETLYGGLKNRRLKDDSGFVSKKGGGDEFNEQALTVLAAEALKRNETAVFTRAKNSADKNTGRLTVLSSPYFGNIVTLDTGAQKQDTVDFARSRLGQKSLSVFEKPYLLASLVSFGERSLSDELFAFAEAHAAPSPEEKKTVSQALGIIDALSADKNRTIPPQTVEQAGKLVEASVLPFVLKSGDEFYLCSDPVAGAQASPPADLALSIYGGRVLSSFGEKTGLPVYRGLGLHLLLSALKQRDEAGFIPRRMVPGSASGDASGFLRPEDLYTVFSDNPAYPHAIPLVDVFGEGSYIWTVVPGISVKRSGNEVLISMPWKKDLVHHFFIKGMVPFKSLMMYGMNWKSDAYFQRYYAGWNYLPERNTIYFKVTQKSDTERITILLE